MNPTIQPDVPQETNQNVLQGENDIAVVRTMNGAERRNMFKHTVKVVVSNTGSRNSSKKLTKRYFKAFTSFAVSQASLPCLFPLLKSFQVSFADFKNFVIIKRRLAKQIKSIKQLFINEDDSDHSQRLNEVFRQLLLIYIQRFKVEHYYKETDDDNGLLVRKIGFKLIRRLSCLNGLFEQRDQA